jgi:hypothetical protein
MRGIRQGSGNSPPDGRTPRPARSVSGPPHGATNLPEGAGRATVGTADQPRIVGDTPPKRSGLPVCPLPPAQPGLRPGVRWAGAPMRPYANRAEAGAVVAAALVELQRERVVVAALPRGGVGVAVPVARLLGAPAHAELRPQARARARARVGGGRRGRGWPGDHGRRHARRTGGVARRAGGGPPPGGTGAGPAARGVSR